MRTQVLLRMSLLIALAVATLAMPAAGQVQVLGLDQNVPLAATLDNPCTTEVEAILFSGAVHLVQEVWLMPNSNLRLIVRETTTLQGQQNNLLLGETSPTYAVSAGSRTDAEFVPGAASLMSHKKVSNNVSEDNFHAILVLDFDPATYQLNLKLEGSCSNGEPEP